MRSVWFTSDEASEAICHNSLQKRTKNHTREVKIIIMEASDTERPHQEAGCVRLKSLEPKEVACTGMAAVKQNIVIVPSLNEI